MYYTCPRMQQSRSAHNHPDFVLEFWRKTVQEWSHRRILSACEKPPRNQDKSLVTSVSSKTRNCSWTVLLSSSKVADKSEFTSIIHYNWLSVFVYTSLRKNTFCHVRLAHHMQSAFVIGCFMHVTLLNPQSINCLRLWRHLATAGDFCSPHFLAQVPQAPLTAFRAVSSLSYVQTLG